MYQIQSLTLTGYVRMRVSELKQITITPTSPIQLILGTNGCGKSSLLDQLTPLPADKHDFTKGGGKTIHITSEGHSYVCKSHRQSTGMEHSFVMDDEELNPGGTAQVQKDLCKKYFHVTPESHDLAMGRVKFSEMAPAKRREWIIALCDTDTEYVLAKYEELRKYTSHLTGAVNINRVNLANETAKIVSEEETQKLERDVFDLQQELAILQAERMPITTPSTTHADNRQRTLQSLHDVSMRLLRLSIVAPYEYECWWVDADGRPPQAVFRSLNDVDMEVTRLKQLVAGKEAVLVTIGEQHDKLQHQHDILVKAGAEGVATLDAQLTEHRAARQAHIQRLRLGLVFSDARAALQAFTTIEEPLTELLRALPINAEDEGGQGRRYGRSRYEGMQAQWLTLTQSLNLKTEALHRLHAQKEHAELHRGQNQHTCPACHHTWRVGVDEVQYAKFLEEIKTAEKALHQQQAVHDALKADMHNVEGYFQQYRDVMTYTKTVGILKPFWDYLFDSRSLTEAPLAAVSTLQLLKRDLQLAVEADALLLKIDEIEKLKAQAAALGTADLTAVKAQLETLALQIGQHTADLAQLQKTIGVYSDYRRQLQTGLQLGEEVDRLYQLAQEHQSLQVEAFRRECVLHCLKEVESALALKESSLRAIHHQKALVESLKTQLARLELQEAAAKIMVKTLSPTTGLIAEGLIGFIRAFVGQMNTCIARIWQYPLQIIPTGFDVDTREQTTELDYRFKAMVDQQDNIIKDLSLGSDGIREILDWAFKYVALMYLNLLETPLFVDEVGRAFDDAHRNAFIDAIKWEMDHSNIPQLFIINHHAVVYSALTNAQICVVDDRNVVIPSGRPYNEHVNIIH